MVYVTLYKRNENKNTEYMGLLSADKVETVSSNVYGVSKKQIEKLVQLTTGYKTSDIFVKNIYRREKNRYKAII